MPTAAMLYGPGDLRVETYQLLPRPSADWTHVAVTSVGICGSDLHWFTEGGIGEVELTRPVVPGHEFAGIALDGPHAGERVAVDPALPCRRCERCRAGHDNLCPTVRFAGHGTLDGGLQQELFWPTELLHPLPESVSDDAGALLEPLGVAIHAVRMAHVRLGDDVLIVGGGPIGVLAVPVARRAGASRVFVVEPLAHRRASARRFGADEAWAPDEAQQAILDATVGRGVDAAIEIAGNDTAIATAVHGVRPGARVALAGIPADPRSSFPASEARRKGLTFAMVRRMHGTYSTAIALATSGIDLDALVSHRYPLTEAAQAFQHADARTSDKIIISLRG